MSDVQKSKGADKKSLPLFFNISFKVIFIIVLIAVFLGIAYYIYITHIEPTLKPTYVNNNEFDTPDSLARQEDVAKNVQVGPKRSQLYLFHTEWCPYSKKVMPIWDKIQATFAGQKIKDTDWVIDFIKINGETEAQKLEKFQADYLQDAAKSKIDGLVMRALARATLCCCPPES